MGFELGLIDQGLDFMVLGLLEGIGITDGGGAPSFPRTLADMNDDAVLDRGDLQSMLYWMTGPVE